MVSTLVKRATGMRLRGRDGEPSIMNANRGAHDRAGASTSPSCRSRNRILYQPGLCFQFHYFAIRKMHFLPRAVALVAFPGGYGTLDELFEALTLVQTGKVRPMPIVLVGREFWQTFMNMDVMIDHGMISREDTKLFTIVETAEEAVQVIYDFYGREVPEVE
jgi:uncharacterized protein (TIGR00730 family)